MSALPTFKAVRRDEEYSLRVIYPQSRLPGDRSSQFGRLRMEEGGWNAWGDDEDLGRALRAACYRAGKHSALRAVLTEIRKTYLAYYHSNEAPWVDSARVLDVTGDYLIDVVDRHNLRMVDERRGNEGERAAVIYMDEDEVTQAIATPHWDAANGSIYSVTLRTRA